MKTKKSDKKIKTLIKRLASLLGKGNKGTADQPTEKVKELQSGLEATQGLQKEIRELKSSLKTRKRELADKVNKLEKDGRHVKKELKKSKKAKAKAEKKPKAEKKTKVEKKPRAEKKPATPRKAAGEKAVAARTRKPKKTE